MEELVRVRHRGLAHSTHSLAPTRPLAVLLVGCEVERDEEEEVGAEDSYSREGGEFLAGTLAVAGHPIEVGRGEVCVGCKVDEAWVETD